MNALRNDRFVPWLMSRLFGLGAVLIVAEHLFGRLPWVRAFVWLFSLLMPVQSMSLGAAALLAILAFALIRRKRLAWWIALGFLGVLWLASVAILVAVIVQLRTEPDRLLWRWLVEYSVNTLVLSLWLGLMLWRRRAFSARTVRGNRLEALTVLVGGLVVTASVAWLLTWAAGGAGRPRGRLGALLRHLVTGGQLPDVPMPPGWVRTVVSVLVAASVFIALLVLLRSQQAASRLALEHEVVVRDLLEQNSSDSLGYFATRRDRAVVMTDDRNAAVSYRVVSGVCLAAGDPLGPSQHWPRAIDDWLAQAHLYGWSAGVVGASEAGARAYADKGLRVSRVGDEAILAPASFDLEAPTMRGVRQAVTRMKRNGYDVRIRRMGEVSDAERHRLGELAERWRRGGPERGFSMALGRFGDDLDARCVLVEALHPADGEHEGATAGMLSFVPWGPRGLSLDLMRRDPAADNGVTELMVSGLMQSGRDLGVERVSLNFAVFREAFAEGERLGASLLQRLQRKILMMFSRWFQLEQLYRSNVKYDPQWNPRFLCVEDPGDLGSVLWAMGVAEGFIELPQWLMRVSEVDQPRVELSKHPELAALVAPPALELPTRAVGEQVAQRMATREAMLARGVEPYPASFTPTAQCAEVAARSVGTELATIAGRVVAVRDHGGVVFVGLQDWSGAVQVVLERREVGAESLAEFTHTISLGDHAGFTGVSGRSNTGTASLLASSWTITAKALRPLPDKYRGISDPETRVRQRYLDLIVNPSARRQLAIRSAAIRSVRDTLQARGYLEVETPMLQTVHGGANARPFRTHINAYDLDLYLRIAPELFLKRLMVGGLDRVFEIGRNFRNEGADATHNPEFTMLEAYQAYGDYVQMREMAHEIIVNAARAALGGTVITGRDHEGVEREVDLAEPWRVVTVNDALSEALGVPITADTDRDELVRHLDGLGVASNAQWTRGEVLLELYERLCEERTVAPTFYTDFPAEVSPLTRGHRDDARLAERWDLVCFGAEIGTAYSELVDPVVQRERLTAQSLLAAGGNPEAMEVDEEFLTALEHAMPPSGGLGMGIDRLVMMLTHASIRETIAFPLVRPRS